jgi:hypothetical protein
MHLSCREGRRRVIIDALPLPVVDHQSCAGRSNAWSSATCVIGQLHHRSWMCHEIEDDCHLMVRTPVKGGRAGATNSHQIAFGRARLRTPPRSHSTAVHPPIGGRMRRREGSRWRHLFLPRAQPPRSSAAGGHSCSVRHNR